MNEEIAEFTLFIKKKSSIQGIWTVVIHYVFFKFLDL